MAVHTDRLLQDDFAGLSLVVQIRGRMTVVELEGEWDLAGVSAVAEAFECVFDDPPESLVLDLSRLSFIGSTGLQGTLDLHNRAAEAGAKFVIIPASRLVHAPFELTALTTVLPFIAPVA